MDSGDTPLTDRQRDLLDFERTWWQYDEPRDELIRSRFGCGPDAYYAELDRVLEHPGAMAHDPLVVRRFQRRRARRRRTLLEGGSASASNADDVAPPREHRGGAH